MTYKPTNEDLLFAKSVYDNVIVNQVLDPLKIKEAYRRIYGSEPQSFQYAKNKVFTYFQYEFKYEMIDNNTIGTIENKDKQSHQEDVNSHIQEDITNSIEDEIIVDEKQQKIDDLKAQIENLEEQLRFHKNEAEQNEFTNTKIATVKAELKSAKIKLSKLK